MDVFRSILITGGGGMLAKALGAALGKRGHTGRLLNRAQCDITQPEQLNRLFREHKPTLVLNCAAHTRVDACEQEVEQANAINGEAVGTLAKLCREYDARMVHYSTDFVFDGQSDRPYRPDDTPSAISAYGRSKLLGEERIRQTSSLAWLIIRTAWLYGRHGNCFPRIIVERGRAGQALKVVNDQLGSPTSVTDLAEATMNLIEANSRGVVHVTNAGQASWFEFAAATLTEFGIGSEISPVSTEEWRRMRPGQAKRPAYSVLDLTEYGRATGKEMRDWRESLSEFREATRNGTDFS